MGYWRAGFDVFGIDIKPQPHYPFEFHQADALELPLEGFDAIHASPPCQRYTKAGWAKVAADQRRHPDLLPPIRRRLLAAGAPYVIENVPGAPMRQDLVLCGSMFGLEVRRHRWFEANWPLMPFALTHDHSRAVLTIAGNGFGGRFGRSGNPRRQRSDWGSFADWRRAMGIPWMTGKELKEAIPPAYTEWIGRQLMALIRKEAA